MQVGSATFIIRVIKHSGICSGDSKILQVASRFQDVKTSHVTSAFCSPCLHAPTAVKQFTAASSISYQSFPGCQDISCDISHHQQQQSPPQNHIHTTPPQNHESCIHRILLPYIVSIMHAYIVSYCHTSYIVSYYSRSCIIASIILLLPLFRQNLTKVECMNLRCKYYRPIAINCSKGHAPITSKSKKQK